MLRSEGTYREIQRRGRKGHARITTVLKSLYMLPIRVGERRIGHAPGCLYARQGQRKPPFDLDRYTMVANGALQAIFSSGLGPRGLSNCVFLLRMYVLIQDYNL